MRAQSLKTQQRKREESDAAREAQREAIQRRVGTYRIERTASYDRIGCGPTSIPKSEVPSWESQTLRDLARDQPCYFESPWCNGRRETTVLIHSDSLEDGNGQGCKPNDLIGAAPGCSDCHHWFGDGKQGTAGARRAMFLKANRRWLAWLTGQGLIKVAK